jgi:hypothetical protein
MQNSLEKIIATLQKLRDVYHSQLDAKDRAEFDDALTQLKKLSHSEKRNLPLGELGLRAVRIIDNTLRVVTNLTDLMK